MTYFSRLVAATFAVAVVVFAAVPALAQEPPEVPPEIEKLMKKAESGRSLTAAEMKKLAEWAQKQAAGAGVTVTTPNLDNMPAEGYESVAPSPGRDTCPKVSKVNATAPTDKAWPKVVASLTKKYADKAGPTKAFVDDAAAAAKTPHEIADVGAMLAMRGLGSAAAYASLLDAARGDDPVTLSNLGNLLDDLDDRKGALDVLLYARRKFPGSPSVLTNLGWVYYAAGDRDAARTAFEAAIRVQKGFPPALEGLALVAHCAKDRASAVAYATEALQHVVAPAMEAILDESNPSVSGRGDPGTTDGGDGGDRSTTAPPGPGGPGGPGSTASGSSTASRRRFPRLPYWTAPDPPFGASAKVFAVDNMEAGRAFFEMVSNKFKEAGQRAAAGAQARRASAPPASASEEMVMVVEPIGAMAAFNEAWKRFEAKVLALVMPANDRFQALMVEYNDRLDRMRTEEGDRHKACESDHCHQAVDYEYCVKYRDLGGRAYADIVPLWSGYWPGTKRAIEEYVNTSGPPIAVIPEPEKSAYQEFRDALVWRHYAYASTFLEMWRGFTAGFMEKECNPPAPPSPVQLTLPGAGNDLQCPLPDGGISLGIGPFGFKVKCDSVKFSAMKGVAVAYERNFVQHSNTFYAGLGDQWRGHNMGASLGSGMYFTTQGGSVSDFGLWSEGNLSAGPAVAEAAGRVSLVSVSSEVALGVSARTPRSWGVETLKAPVIKGGVKN